jgi:hypothetical protein
MENGAPRNIGIAFYNVSLERENSDKLQKQTPTSSPTPRKSLFARVLDLYQKRQRFRHCEVAFFPSTNDDTCLAFGVFTNVGVWRNNRTFSNPNYTWINLTVSGEEYRNALHFCESCVGKGVDWEGLKRLQFWPETTQGQRQQTSVSPFASSPDIFWCTSFTVSVLHRMNILTSYRSNSLDVDDVYDLLEHHPASHEAMTPLDIKHIQDLIGVP